jgi:hypothetical protein
MDINKEKKLGRAILEIVSEISTTPYENVRRFLILDRNLKRAVKAYRDHTGSDYLLGKTPAYYGLETMTGDLERELKGDNKNRRNGTEPE